MRSRTSREVPEWSGGEELYIGSPVLATGKVSGVIGIVPGPPEGSRGSTGWGHLSRRAPWAESGREPAPSGLGAPHGPPPMRLGLGTLGWGASTLPWGARQPLPPTIYRAKGEGEGAALPLPPRKGAAKGGGVHPPQGTSEVPSPFRTLPSFILAHGPLGAGALGPCRPRRTPYSPCGPPGQVAPPGGPPGPFRWSRYNTDNPETCPDARNSTSYI